MDDFFKKTNCDRCGASLSEKGRIMSMFNMDCICLDCKEAETKRPDYELARETESKECLKGNYNFRGIGYKPL